MQSVLGHQTCSHGEGRGYVDNIVQFPVQPSTNPTSAVRPNLAARRTTQAAESLTCYEQIKQLADYMESHGTFGKRNSAMFITGVATGLRISDLVRLKVKDVYDLERHEFLPCIDISELKTGKRTKWRLDEVLITEAMREALSKYFDSLHWKLSGNDYCFRSRKANGDGEYRLDESQGYRIISGAAKDAGITDVHVGSHTMRKTFLNIAYAIGTTSNLRNSTAVLMDLQILARHASLESTKRYMNMEKPRLLSLREGVSNFLLGRTKIKQLAIRYEVELEDEDED